MKTMKKKVLVAMALATAMVAMPVVAGAAGSVHYSSDSDGSDYSSSSSSSGGSSSHSSSTGKSGSTTTQGGFGAVVVSDNSSVQVTDTGAKVDVVSTTRDLHGSGSLVGLIGTAAGNGAVTVDGVKVSIATDAAETAGLPEEVVNTIVAMNGSASVNELLPGLGMEGYAKAGGTRAVVAKNAANEDAAAWVTLYVAALSSDAKEVGVVYYNNMTGQWNAIKNVSVDLATKTVTFLAPASCTIQVVMK